MKSSKTFFKKSIVLVVALQLLNMGLFNQTFTLQLNNSNVINSLTEYIAEVIFKKQNAFPENDQQNQDKHSHNHHTVKAANFHWITAPKLDFSLLNVQQKNIFCLYKSKYYSIIFFDRLPKPPKNVA